MSFFAPRRFLSLMLCALFCCGVSFLDTAHAASMPAFHLESVTDGKKVASESFKDKVVLVTFWATWCPPCRMEIPGLIELQKKYSDKGFTVLGLTVDQGPREMVHKFMRKENINYPVLLATPELGRAFGGVVGIPTSFLVDRKGEVVKRFDGFVEHTVVEGKIKDLL